MLKFVDIIPMDRNCVITYMNMQNDEACFFHSYDTIGLWIPICTVMKSCADFRSSSVYNLLFQVS